MSEQCMRPTAPCSFRVECAKTARCEYLQLRQAINDVLHVWSEMDQASNPDEGVLEPVMSKLKGAFDVGQIGTKQQSQQCVLCGRQEGVRM